MAELNDPLGKIGGYMNEEISASDFILAQRIRAILQVKMDEIFQHVDVLATASLPVTASKLDANLDEALTFADPIGGIGNICGLPAISCALRLWPARLAGGHTVYRSRAR